MFVQALQRSRQPKISLLFLLFTIYHIIFSHQSINTGSNFKSLGGPVSVTSRTKKDLKSAQLTMGLLIGEADDNPVHVSIKAENHIINYYNSRAISPVCNVANKIF